MDILKALMIGVRKEWEESAHPRDEKGRFGDGGSAEHHAVLSAHGFKMIDQYTSPNKELVSMYRHPDKREVFLTTRTGEGKGSRTGWEQYRNARTRESSGRGTEASRLDDHLRSDAGRQTVGDVYNWGRKV